MTRKLIKALREQKQQNKQVDLQIYGSLGVPLNGSKLVEVPNRNSYVYVRLRDNQNEVIQAFNNKVATSYGLPVIVHREGPRYVVDGVNTLRYNNNLNNFAAYLPKHGQVHSFFPGGGGDVVWTYSRQMMPLLVYPNSANTGTGVTLYSQPLLINNQWQLVGGTGTQDFSIYIPTGSNSVMGLIYLDANTGNPGVLINSGTPMSSSITGTGDVMPYVPVPNLATQIPLAAVKINTGTTTVGWDNLYDMREWVHVIPSGTSSGGGGSGTFVNIWDEGIFQGTVNTLNVVSSVADISVSGTVARLFITGSTGGGTVNPPVTGSFVVQNNGLTLGSATILNFTNGVSASISGSVAQIVVTGTATYVRTAPPISLSSVTGAYWQTQEGIFVSGSLALFNQGHALIPSIDYLEQYPSSGTFQYISTPPTGTYNLAIYGVPVAGGNSSSGGGTVTPATVNPTSISGCVLWYDMSTLSGVTGDAIGTVTDGSSSANNATQGTTAAKPLLQENAFNGKKALMFDGTNSWMQLGTNIDLAAAHTLVIVMSGIKTGAIYRSVFAWKQYRLYSMLNGTFDWGVYRNTDVPGGTVSGNVQIVGSWFNTSADYSLINGLSRFKSLIAGSSLSDTTSYLGRDAAAAQFHAGFICEVAMWNNKISETDLVSYLKWLQYKWQGVISS